MYASLQTSLCRMACLSSSGSLQITCALLSYKPYIHRYVLLNGWLRLFQCVNAVLAKKRRKINPGRSMPGSLSSLSLRAFHCDIQEHPSSSRQSYSQTYFQHLLFLWDIHRTILECQVQNTKCKWWIRWHSLWSMVLTNRLKTIRITSVWYMYYYYYYYFNCY